MAVAHVLINCENGSEDEVITELKKFARFLLYLIRYTISHFWFSQLKSSCEDNRVSFG